jgi:hyperosmotically inducible periplasmic protein
MKSVLYWCLVGLICAGTMGLSAAQSGGQPSTGSQRMQERITREVRHGLVLLPQLTIFDNLQYKVDGSTVTLLGEVRNPVLKDSAEGVVKKIEGVEKVDNKIDVLPASPNDDHLRLAVAHALFGQDSPLFRYAMGALPPIHIVVKNGHVTLEGVVDSQADKDLAYLKANGVPGVFSVDNHLVVKRP